MALTTELVADYASQKVVQERTKSALLYWAGYVATLPVPTEEPEESWVRQRILSDRITRNPDSYVQSTNGFYMQDANIQTNMRDLMDGYPTEQEETSYAAFMESATSAQMGRFAETEVSDASVDQWYADNGFGPVAEGQAQKSAKKIVSIEVPKQKKAA